VNNSQQGEKMQFKVEELHQKNTEQVRALFSTVPKTENQIILTGKFKYGGYFYSHVAQALAYLPKHVTAVVFRVEFYIVTNVVTIRDDEYKYGPNFISSSRQVTSYTKRVGKGLQFYVASLPESIKSIYLHFIENAQDGSSRSITSDLAKVIKNIPGFIKHLDLNLMKALDEAIVEAIPETISQLSVNRLKLGMFSIIQRESIFSALNRTMTYLSLMNAELYFLDAESLSCFAEGLPPNLITLDLGCNELHQKTVNELSFLLSSLFSLQALKSLGLSGNQLSRFNPQDLAQVLSSLPETLEELDLGENGLLVLDPDAFRTIMGGLPKTLSRLRLCDKGVALSKEQLKTYFLFIPDPIETINFSDSDLLGLSVAEFTETLSSLPDTIRILDLSGNELYKNSVEMLCFLFSNIPPTIEVLKLKQNNLSSLSTENFERVLSHLPKSITGLDISENGFDRLYRTHLNEFLQAIPHRIKHIVLDEGQFGIRNDGALMPYAHSQHHGLFKPQGIIRQQRQFANLRIVMMQMIKTGMINLDIANLILSYLVNPSVRERKYMYDKLVITLISSKPPTDITLAVQQECQYVVQQRISLLTAQDTKLDLSRCGLNRLSEAMLSDLFEQIPRKVTSISLRGNGFQYKKETRNALIAALIDIPKWVTYLDLSDNGFEHYSAEELKQLFIHLPATGLYVSLSHEKPLSPAQHIAKKTFPNSYNTLTMGYADIMKQAQALLNDYTKSDFSLGRFFCGHWNRHYVEKVAKLTHDIDKGIITNIEDLLCEFEQMKMPYEIGSLGRRIAFLYKLSLSNPARNQEAQPLEDSDEVEMQELTL
jgi:Ran GTPase-activating protein (RanGAP) involved in mRNA processing and transport